MSCSKCKRIICCCVTVISRKGPRGKDGNKGKNGANGPPGPPAPPFIVIGQSAFWGGISGPLVQGAPGNLFNNLESNFFQPTLGFYSISVGAHIESTVQHTVTAYFKKNGVQVGPTYNKTMFPKDELHFHTNIIPFINGDFLDLYVETDSPDAVISPGHLIHYRQL